MFKYIIAIFCLGNFFTTKNNNLPLPYIANNKQAPQVLKQEQLKIFKRLNKIRANKNKYQLNYKIEPQLIINKKQLVYNYNLEKAAEAKALDMANRDYFDHINPDGFAMNFFINQAGYTLPKHYLTNINLNYFESIGAGAANGEAMLKLLIIDEGVPTYAHRNHLLGVGAFNKTLVNIGIGFVKTNNLNNKFITYCCVLIAKH